LHPYRKKKGGEKKEFHGGVKGHCELIGSGHAQPKKGGIKITIPRATANENVKISQQRE